jgi:hypothetical protein
MVSSFKNYRITLILTVVFCILFINGSSARETSGFFNEKTNKLTTYIEAVDWLKHVAEEDSRISLETTGHSEIKKIPIAAVKINDPSFLDTGKLRVMVIAGTHGNEPAGMEAMLRFIDEMSHADTPIVRKYYENFTFYIIPCLNPEGAEKAMEFYRDTDGFWMREGRFNGRGLDINRDYITLYTQEARTAVRLFNRIKPHVVFDLHEYASIPLIVAGDGWWKETYFDVLLGAGRHPDVYPPLSGLAREIVERELFPTLRMNGLRGEYYMLSGGDFETTRYRASTAADYFNVRNAMTFLIETPGYDHGEKNLDKRVSNQLTTFGIILKSLSEKHHEIIRLTRESAEYMKRRTGMTLAMKRKPRPVKIGSKTSDTFNLNTSINIEGKEYYAPARIRFTTGDYYNRRMVGLPQAYAVFIPGEDFIERVRLSNIMIYQAKENVELSGVTIPEGVFLIPVGQESSVIIGTLFDEMFMDNNMFSPKDRYLSIPVKDLVNMDYFVPIKDSSDIKQAVEKFRTMMLKGFQPVKTGE